MVRDIGWDYYEALAKQNVMQVQSATDPPKKLSLGERSVMADGTEYNIFLLKESGQPVEAVYPTEGTPFIVGPNGIFKAAPNPNAAKLFQNYCFTPEAQQIIIESGGLRSLHPQVKEHAGPQAARRDQADEGRRRGRREGRAKRSRRAIRNCSVSEPSLRAKRSNPVSQKLDCFVASLLAMTKRRPDAMRKKLSRRDLIKGSAALGLSALATRVMAAAPAPVSITPDLVEAAKKEGKVILYSSMDLPVGEKLGKAFEAQYPGIAVQIERSGSERLFQRVDQEFASNIRAVDVINTFGRLAHHHLEEERLAGAVRHRGHRAAFPARISRSRRHERDLADLAVVDRLQHQTGEAGRRAEKLRRPARSEMGRQDGQGPSRL